MNQWYHHCFFLHQLFQCAGFPLSTPGSRDNLTRDWDTEERETAGVAAGTSRHCEGGGSSGSREGSSVSSTRGDCPASPGDRDGLVSPDIIRTVASTIQPSPRRRINNPGTCTHLPSAYKKQLHKISGLFYPQIKIASNKSNLSFLNRSTGF